jgi:hypothetical protein
MPPAKEAEDLSALIRAGADDGDDYEEPAASASSQSEPAEPEQPEPQAAEPDAAAPAAAAAAPAEEPEKPAVEEPFIPKSRFDEINERRKAAEAKLRELEAREKAADPANVVDFDFKGKEKAYMDAVLDGDTDKALTIRDEIRIAEQSLFQQMTQKAEQTARTAAKQDIKLEQTISELTSKYPTFDPDHADYSDDLTREALSFQRTFISDGYDPDKALRKAVAYVAKIHDLTEAGAAPAPQGLQAAAAAPATPKPTQAQVEGKMRVAGQQPPVVPSAGKDAPRGVNIMEMSDEEFEKLSPDEIRKFRGDYRPTT